MKSSKSFLPPLYLRREPTTDVAVLGLFPARKMPRDVVAYTTPEAVDVSVARWTWFFSAKPTRRNRHVVLNRVRRDVVWLPDAT